MIITHTCTLLPLGWGARCLRLISCRMYVFLFFVFFSNGGYICIFKKLFGLMKSEYYVWVLIIFIRFFTISINIFIAFQSLQLDVRYFHQAFEFIFLYITNLAGIYWLLHLRSNLFEKLDVQPIFTIKYLRTYMLFF